MATKTYIVKHPKVSYGKADENGKVIRKARDYPQGAPIELDDDDAAQLLEVGALEEALPEAKAKK